MEKNTKRKLFALVSSYIILFNSFILYKNRDSDDIVYNEKHCYLSGAPFAYYKDKNIYIGFRCDYDDMENIYVLDSRFSSDPDMRIINSYKINNLRDMRNILKILVEYENKYPSCWDRSLNAMELEWFVHNICYFFDIESHRSGDVDLNNSDENKYLILNKK